MCNSCSSIYTGSEIEMEELLAGKLEMEQQVASPLPKGPGWPWEKRTLPRKVAKRREKYLKVYLYM